MFRTHEANKSPNEPENDDGYEFSGATLKISGEDEHHQSAGIVADGKLNQSAILSGSDAAASPLPPVGDNNLPSSSGLSEEISTRTVTTTKPKVGSPARFFSFRTGQFERAVEDCVNVLLKPANDTDIIGSWLLTDVSHWDHEHERVYVLTRKTLLQVKYDFIALRILQHEKIRLTQVDTILRGKISYPQSSLVPERNDHGIRIMWNKGQPISLLKSWNPFSSEIPWKTIKDHPLFGYQDPYNTPGIQEGINKNRLIYSVEELYQALIRLYDEEKTLYCRFAEEPIVMENYVGIGAVIHNKNNFGFFKVRGKFSF